MFKVTELSSNRGLEIPQKGRGKGQGDKVGACCEPAPPHVTPRNHQSPSRRKDHEAGPGGKSALACSPHTPLGALRLQL